MAKFCCEYMKNEIEVNFIEYDEVCRDFSLRADEKCLEDAFTLAPIWYCPWCGTKLPKELGDEWMDTLYNEYGIQRPNFEDADKVPEEFKSDKWWKKRGL